MAIFATWDQVRVKSTQYKACNFPKWSTVLSWWESQALVVAPILSQRISNLKGGARRPLPAPLDGERKATLRTPHPLDSSQRPECLPFASSHSVLILFLIKRCQHKRTQRLQLAAQSGMVSSELAAVFTSWRSKFLHD